MFLNATRDSEEHLGFYGARADEQPRSLQAFSGISIKTLTAAP